MTLRATAFPTGAPPSRADTTPVIANASSTANMVTGTRSVVAFTMPKSGTLTCNWQVPAVSPAFRFHVALSVPGYTSMPSSNANSPVVFPALTARENVEFQMEYLRTHGQAGVVVVFFDRMTGQDSEARRLYGNLPDLKVLRGSALVGGTMLGRAIGTFFLGVARPRIPVQLFSSVEEAVAWARSLNGAASSAKESPA